MSNSIAPGSSADVNIKVTALTTNPNVPVTYKTIILKKNLVNGVNILTQEMMAATNTKYVIKYDYILGNDITVPADCILEFDGGSISGNFIIDLNGSKIIGSKGCFDGITIKKEKGICLRTSWFKWGTDGSQQLSKLLTTCSDYAHLYVDCDIQCLSPIVISGNFFGTVIEGIASETGNTKIVANYTPKDNDIFLTFESLEYVWIKNLSFTFITGNNDRSPIKATLLKARTESVYKADLDLSFFNCSLYSNFDGPLCDICGRGFVLENSFLVNNTVSTKGALIKHYSIGGNFDSSISYVKPADANRAVYIRNCRIHNAINKYLIEFLPDEVTPEAVVWGVHIENNHSDLGCNLIKSSARLRDVLISGNTMHVDSSEYLAEFRNQCENLIISDNIFGNSYGTQKSSCEIFVQIENSSDKFENILISNNVFDTPKGDNLLRIEGKNFAQSTGELYNLNNISIIGNIFTAISFTLSNHDSSIRALFCNDSCSITNLIIKNNINGNKTKNPYAGIQFHTYGQIISGLIKNVRIIDNLGFNDIYINRDNVNYKNIDVIENINLSRYNNIGGRPTLSSEDIGYQLFDTSISPARPIYWNGTAWVDATGTPV